MGTVVNDMPPSAVLLFRLTLIESAKTTPTNAQ